MIVLLLLLKEVCCAKLLLIILLKRNKEVRLANELITFWLLCFVFSVNLALTSLLYFGKGEVQSAPYWKCNFPVTPSARRSVGWLVDRRWVS